MRFSILLAVVLACTVVQAGDWPQFRGPTGDGLSDAVGLPETWSETEHIRWKTPIPGTGWSSPVILDGQVWMTTSLDKGKSLRAVCVDQQSGDVLHNVEVFQVEKPGEVHQTNSYASPTPVLEAGRVYVHFGTYGTACLDTSSGSVLWRNTDLKLDHEVGPGSSVALHGPLVLLICDGIDTRFVAALDKQTGKIAWKKPRPGELKVGDSSNKAFSTPLVISVKGRDQAIMPSAQRVISYDPKTGKELWQVDYPGFSNVPRPVYGHGLVFVGTGYMKPELWAIRPDGEGDVTKSHVVWKVTRQAPANPSPVLHGSELYMLSDQGVATCLDAKTGKENWVQRIGGKYSASLIYADGRIYLCAEDGKTTVFAPNPLKYQQLAVNTLEKGCMASPAIADKALYLRTTTHLYRIEQ